MNDIEIVEGLRRQDPAAVRQLSECYLPSIWRFVFVRTKGDRHLAEDIVSETMLALIKAVAIPGAEILSPSAWLRSVATHKLQDHFRAAARVQHLIDQAVSVAELGAEADPAGREEGQERRAAVRKALDDLPEPHRLALEWKYIEHLSVRDIAGRLVMTEKAVESLLFRARRELREALQGLQHLDVSWKSNGHTRPERNERAAASEPSGSDSRSEIETQHEDLTQRQSR